MVHPFRRNRALTAAVVLTLSTGVGVSAAMFNLVDVLLFRPPAHVNNTDRLVEVPSAKQLRSISPSATAGAVIGPRGPYRDDR